MDELRDAAPGNTPSAEEVFPVTLKELLEAGVHFGHPKSRWNPKMKPYIFTTRGGVHIIDLRITLLKLKEAYAKVREVAFRGGNILFVGTKKQAKDIIKEEAERAGVFYVNERWPGGLLTNFKTIKGRLAKIRELEAKLGELDAMRAEGKVLPYTKKEIALMEKELQKLYKLFGGVRDMETTPDLLFIVDIVQEDIAVREARKLGITTVAMVDTNADPTLVDYPIPANDDAMKSIRVITRAIADAVLEGKGGRE